MPDLKEFVSVDRLSIKKFEEIMSRVPKAKFTRLADMLKANMLAHEIPESENPLNRLTLRLLKRIFKETVTVGEIVQGVITRNGFGSFRKLTQKDFMLLCDILPYPRWPIIDAVPETVSAYSAC
jgi:hypothetical protein